ncbi:MAG: flotillin family protein [Hyphomicrobiales bacterium]|nr:flotillin family protein [Hyphomicrobiales bacterium]
MDAQNFMGILIVSGTILVALIAIGLIFARLYQRTSKEISFVRTGLGGQKVVINGGCIVLPVLHEAISVNMNTLRLEVRRSDQQALITRDRMRVDVQAEFYVRVQPTTESIAAAAQTLGIKTMHPNDLKQLVEGKFVDALRAVAAEMSMEELHEQRVNFVQKVQTAVSEDLLKNGLELESVSLTGLDQTNREFFNPDNAFDAAGLTRLTDEIEERRRRRNEIEQDSQVAIETKNLEADRKKFEIARDVEYARLEQEREIEIRRASQTALIASEQAIKKRDADLARIEADRNVQEEEIEKQRKLREKEIEREKSVELANQEREIAIAEKSRDQSVAKAEADRARAEAVREEEMVVTVRETECAEREKAVELVEARKAAERDAIKITVGAQAEKAAADDEAASIKILAEADAEKLRIIANAEADSEKARADAAKVRYEVDAEGQHALNEAENLLSQDIVNMKIKVALIEHLSGIVRESVRPLENIDGIKIIQVDGLTNGGSGSGKANSSSEAGLSDQLVASALKYRSQAPLIDSLMKEVGITGGSLSELVRDVHSESEPENTPEEGNENEEGSYAASDDAEEETSTTK